MISTLRLNRIGDNGQPCLTSDNMGISPVSPEGVQTIVRALV